jgi:hypothetical protein
MPFRVPLFFLDKIPTNFLYIISLLLELHRFITMWGAHILPTYMADANAYPLARGYKTIRMALAEIY